MRVKVGAGQLITAVKGYGYPTLLFRTIVSLPEHSYFQHYAANDNNTGFRLVRRLD